MADIDPCPKCGSNDIDGPNPSRRKTGRTGKKYQRQMRFNCRGCDHVYQFDVHGGSAQARTKEAVARWTAARPAQMKPTQRLAAELGLID
jgi:hypothetical protein